MIWQWAHSERVFAGRGQARPLRPRMIRSGDFQVERFSGRSKRRPYSQICYFSYVLCLCLVVFILFLSGCDASSSLNTSATTPTSPLGNSTPKGPGSAGLTATALATPTITRCPNFASVQPASTTGWTRYIDAHYGFSILVPTDWKAGTFTSGSADNSESYYDLLLLPANSTLPFTQEGMLASPQYITLSIQLSGTAPNFASNPDWKAEAMKQMVANIATAVYDRTSPDCDEVNRATDNVKLGEHSLHFYLETHASMAQQDISLFLAVLKSFAYTGK